MVTVERAAAHLQWHALVWRGAVVWTELTGTCDDEADGVARQIRERLPRSRTRGVRRGVSTSECA